MSNKQHDLDSLEMFNQESDDSQLHLQQEEAPPEATVEETYAEESEYEEEADPGEYEESFDDIEYAADELLSTDESAQTPEPTQMPRQQRRSRAQRSQNARPAQSTLLVTAGMLVMIAGFCLALATVLAPEASRGITRNLNLVGLTPGLLVALGALVNLVALMRNSQQDDSFRLDQLEDELRGNDEFAAESLEYLVRAQEQSHERRPASGEELDQVLHCLSRQDEKINNLTKALKMYGKPLVEVSKQIADLGAKTQGVAHKVDEMLTQDLVSEVKQAMQAFQQQLGGQLEELSETQQTGVQALTSSLDERLQDLTASINERIQAVTEDLPSHAALEQLASQLREEVRAQDAQSALGELRRELGAQIEAVAAQLGEEAGSSDTLKNLRSELADEFGKLIAQLPKGDEESAQILRSLQSEMGSVQMSLSQLKNQPVAAAAAAPAAATPAPAAPPQPPAASAPTEGKGPGGLASSISGTSKKSGAGVAGAIAKLRKMR